MTTIPTSHSDLLNAAALAYLATIGPNGEPQVSAVWFTWDGTHLLFALSKKRQKSRNLLRDPRVAVAIADPANPYRALEIRGVVTRVEEDSGYRFMDAASRKYLHRDATDAERGPEDERLVFYVEPERVFPFPLQADHLA